MTAMQRHRLGGSFPFHSACGSRHDVAHEASGVLSRQRPEDKRLRTPEVGRRQGRDGPPGIEARRDLSATIEGPCTRQRLTSALGSSAPEQAERNAR